ncbi:MAG: cardiolipin synthase [Chthoniobacter sp.]|nr:cardiolipin synthase [Chthoniobacter sp.]
MRASLLALHLLVLAGCAFQGGKKLREPLMASPPTDSAEFRQAMGTLLGSSFCPGNKIVTLVNGDEIFPAMLKAIRGARRSINFETYVFWDGNVARELAEALAERAEAGVKVHAVLDAQGTNKMGHQNLARMRNAGVEVRKYHKLFWWDLQHYDNRTHRKLLIVDGKTGFIGGVGIANEWEGNAKPPQWRDNHYEVTGPVVAQLQAIFMDNWLKADGSVLLDSDYFPPLNPAGSYLAQAFKSSPQFGDIDVHLMYLMTIASAQKTLVIENAYFLPDRLTRQELIAAAKRGVKVEILIPGRHIDQKLVRHASRRHWAEFLRAGIRLYEYEPSMVHVKLLVADGFFTSVGSANFDSRSIRLNDEANLNVLNRSFAARQTQLFEIDKRKARPVTLDSEGKVTLGTPVEHVAGLAESQL